MSLAFEETLVTCAALRVKTYGFPEASPGIVPPGSAEAVVSDIEGLVPALWVVDNLAETGRLADHNHIGFGKMVVQYLSYAPAVNTLGGADNPSQAGNRHKTRGGTCLQTSGQK